MEIFGYHPQLGKKVEIGNSGVFRPEMLKPMVLFHYHIFVRDYLKMSMSLLGVYH